MYEEDNAVMDGLRDRIKILKSLINLADSHLLEVIGEVPELTLKDGRRCLQTAMTHLEKFLRETK